MRRARIVTVSGRGAQFLHPGDGTGCGDDPRASHKALRLRFCSPRRPDWLCDLFNSLALSARCCGILPGLLTSLLFPALLLASTPAQKPSPLDLHRELRVQYLTGRPAGERIQGIVDRIGDHSYDSLRFFRAGIARGLLLEREAVKAWDGGHHDEALRKYRMAFDLLEADGATSETAFCLYYMAEVLSAREDYQKALFLLDQADSRAVGCHYLGALIADSRGYCLWFQDRLPASARSFSRATGLWQRLDFPDGTVVSWNNLALLYEEMKLRRRASECYRESLVRANRDRVSPEIRFYLYSNYSAFLLELGDRRGAAEYLAEAEPLGFVSPDDLFILRCRVVGTEPFLAHLEPRATELPSLRIEKLLLLGDRASSLNTRSTEQFYRRALEMSKAAGLRRDTRNCTLRLGRWLESERRYTEAGRLYLAGFEDEENLHAPELFFPYSRTVSPLLDGWVRALVASGDEWRALSSIHKLTELRRDKARAILQNVPIAPDSGDALETFAQVAVVEDRPARKSSPSLFETLEPAHDGPWDDSRVPQSGWTILELWPDGNKVYAWGKGPGGRFFRTCALPGSCSEIVDQLLDPLYAPSSSLPQPPPDLQLQQLYRALFRPLENDIRTPGILLIPHKELQSLPFEMMRDDNGNWLASRHDFAYLPSLPPVSMAGKATGPPSVIVPGGPTAVSTAEQERAFFRLFLPGVRVRHRLEFDEPERPSWVHVSGHLRLNDGFWAASTLQDETGRLNILGFLHGARDCSLVSLGVCDAGNGYSSQSPYWLGFTELLLSQGVDAVVVNRWRMDDLSSAIYMDFYRLALAGLPMEQALSRARRNFLRRTLHRGAASIAGNHPFFWAGVTFVGLPGQRLYPPQRTGWELLLLDGLLLSGVIIGLARWRRVGRANVKDNRDNKDYNDDKDYKDRTTDN